MATLDWTPELVLGDARIDETHREFVDAVNAVGDASDDAMLAAIDALIAHTEEHFGQEERWMAATSFPPTHCHLDEHAGVLNAIRETRGTSWKASSRWARCSRRNWATGFAVMPAPWTPCWRSG